MIKINSLLYRLVNTFFSIYTFLILVRVISSWVRTPMDNPTFRRILRFTYQATEPVLAPIRELIPLQGIDISPIIALLLLQIIENWIKRLLFVM